ncbi:MAG: transaldolase [Nanoarchaeota archaeon]|nr:transaldolase [Nanoarchaeota archaeon]
MKIFIDSADINEIKQFYSFGLADGITTNPSLVKKAMTKHKIKDMKQYINQILKVAKYTPVSLEVTERSKEKMISQGIALYKLFNPIAKNVVIKIPVSSAFSNKEPQFEGIEAIRTLSKQKIPVNCTLIFTPEQSLLAAKAGATYVSPFAGRIDDLLRKGKKFNKEDYFPAQGLQNKDDLGISSGIDLISQTVQLFKNYNIKTKVLAASLRNPRQVREAGLAGADIATLPFPVIQKMLVHEKTFEGMKNFTKDIVPEYAKLTN